MYSSAPLPFPLPDLMVCKDPYQQQNLYTLVHVYKLVLYQKSEHLINVSGKPSGEYAFDIPYLANEISLVRVFTHKKINYQYFFKLREC